MQPDAGAVLGNVGKEFMIRRVRVLSVIGDLGFGGGETRLLSLARHIDRSRFEHKVLSLLQPDPSKQESVEMRRCYREAGVEVIDLGEARADCATTRGIGSKTAGLFRRIRKLRGVIREFDADVIDAHLEAASLTGVAASLITGKRVAVTLYHAQPLVPVRFWKAAAGFIIAASDVVITDSCVRSKEIAESAQVRRPKILAIPNGIEPPAAQRSLLEMRALLRLPADARLKVVGQVSGLVEFKGHLVLLEAARQVLRTHPDTVFLFIGYVKQDPEYIRRLERKAAELGVAERLRIMSYPGPIGDIWNIIDVHVHASLFDSLPNAIIEGMSLAKPAVVTNVGGVPEMVENGRTGLVVPANDASALAAALVRMLDQPDLARQFGEAARERYLERCRPELMVQRLEDCFQELSQRRRAAAAECECHPSKQLFS